MTGALDNIMRPLAQDLIEKFGGSVSYFQTTETYDATTGKTSQTETERTVVITPPQPYNQNRINDTTIQVGDLETMVKALNLGFTPAIGDKVLFDGSRWQVVSVMPLYSGALAAAYTLQLRQ